MHSNEKSYRDEKPIRTNNSKATLRDKNFYQALFKDSRDAIFLMENDKVIDCNQNACKIFGCSKDILLESSPTEFSPKYQPDGQLSDKKSKNLIQKALESGSNSFEWRSQRIDGNEFDSQVYLNKIELMGKSYIYVVLRDISSRLEAIRALRESEEKFRTIAEHTKIAIIIIQNNEIKYCNPKFIELSGYELEELHIHGSPYNFVHPDDRKEVENKMQFDSQLVNSDNEFTFRILTKSDETVIVEQQSGIITYNSKPAIMSTFIDITSRKNAEEALLSSEQQFRFLVENTNDVVYWIDNQGIITYLSPQIKNYGVDPEVAIGNNFLNFIADEDQDRLLENFEKTITAGLEFPTQFRFKDLNNNHYWFEENGKAVYSEDGSIVGVSGVMRNIDDRKLLEQNQMRRIERIKSQRKAIIELATSKPIIEGNISTALKLICETAAEVIDVERVSIRLYDSNSFKLRNTNLFTKSSSVHTAIKDCDLSKYSGFLNSLKFNRSISAENALKDSRTRELSETFLVPNKITSLLAAPVRKYGIIVGILCFEHTGAKRKWEDDEVSFAGETADQILQLLQNAENRKTEAALKESEERFRDLADSLPQIVFEMDTDGRLVYVNKNAFHEFGYTHEDFMQGLYALDMIVPEDREKATAKIEKAFQGQKLKGEEYTAQRKDSSTFPIIIYSSLIVKESKPVGLRGIIVNITDRKEAETALKQSEKRYQTLFNLVAEGIGITDENENIKYCNPSFAKIFDEANPDRLVGKNLMDYCDPDYHETVLEGTRRRSKGISSEYELKIKTAKNRIKFLHTSISPLYDDNNKFIGSIGAVLDITETKRLQEFLSRAQRLETAGSIAGQVAHDFNNLLGPLTAYPEIIRAELPEDHSAHPFLNDIENAAEQMADINQQLLTLGRRGHYNTSPLNLNGVIKQVLDQTVDIPERIKIKLELEPELKNIIGGKSQIYRVIVNLVNNSIDAIRDVGEIRIRTENVDHKDRSGNFTKVPEGKYVKVSISDTGCGMPDDILPNIFEPFFTTKPPEKKRGSGLGLSIVHTVLEDHRGFIDWKSTPDKGTTFYLYFPPAEKEEEISKQDEVLGGNESILIIDDDEMQRTVNKNLLTKLGYNVHTANSGESGLEQMKKNKYDLILIDMIMPDGIDGADTFIKARSLNPEQKGIIVSGYAETERVRKALNAGAGEFLKKPLTMRSLSLAIRRELDRKLHAVN